MLAVECFPFGRYLLFSGITSSLCPSALVDHPPLLTLQLWGVTSMIISPSLLISPQKILIKPLP